MLKLSIEEDASPDIEPDSEGPPPSFSFPGVTFSPIQHVKLGGLVASGVVMEVAG